MKLAKLLALLALVVPLSAPAQPTPATTADPKIAFEKYTLPNGLEVILVPDKSVPIVAVNV